MARLPLRTALRIAPQEARNRTTAALLRATRRRPFELEGTSYPYLFHHYNTTWRNERTVEVPIAAAALSRHARGNVLEVGNVLANYLPASALPESRTVIDKYEQAPGVINEDVVAHRPPAPYELIVSLSTIEHVGQDEEPCEPAKALRAIELMRSWLAPGGELLVTVPLGHNPALDEAVLGPEPPFATLRFMCRLDARNNWAEAGAEQVRGARYGSPFPFANAIAVGRSSG